MNSQLYLAAQYHQSENKEKDRLKELSIERAKQEETMKMHQMSTFYSAANTAVDS